MLTTTFVNDIDLSKTDLNLSTLDRLIDQLLDYSVSLGLKIVAAFIIFFIGQWVIKWLRKFINRFLSRRQIEETVKSFLDSLANISLKTVLFLFIVNILGIQTTSFAAILAAAGLAIGMSMKDNLSNFAGGVMLLINKPFKIGDRIVAQGTDGIVRSIGILYTVLLTGDNITIYVPNGPLSTGNITNYSAQGNRRLDISYTLGTGADIDEAKEILRKLIQAENLISTNPEPFIGVTSVNNVTLDVTIRVWVKNSDYTAVSVSLNEKVYKSFNENRIYSPSLLSVKMVKD